MSRQKRSAAAWIEASDLLASLIRQARRERGLTQEELARLADLAVPTVRKIESASTREPGIFTVLAIWNVLGIPLVDLGVLLRGADRSTE